MNKMKCYALVASVCAIFLSTAAMAQFGTQPSRIIFPFAAGGSGDAVARLIADRMRVETGQAVVVENRTGAAGRIGVEVVKTATPDGTTLLLTPFSLMVVYPHIYTNMKYNPDSDFVPVSQVASFEFALAVANKVPAKTVAEFVSWLKAHPEQGTYGTPGAGTLQHFFGIALSRAAGLDLKHIGYRGASAAVSDLVSGQIPIVVLATADVLEHHKSGAIRILATLDETQSPYLPDVPTLKASGYDLHGNGWFALYAPAKTPRPIVDQISKIVASYARSNDFKSRLLALGLLSTGTTPDELAAIQKREAKTWEPIIKASGFRPTD